MSSSSDDSIGSSTPEAEKEEKPQPQDVDYRKVHDVRLYTGLEAIRNQQTPQYIFEYLYIGDVKDARQREKLRERNITAVINMAWQDNFHEDDGVDYLKLDIYDAPGQDLAATFNITQAFIEEKRDAGHVVLVHCHAGMSRAPSVCIAYCMSSLGMPLVEAYHTVRIARGFIMPNPGFLRQLVALEQRIHGFNTMCYSMQEGFRALTEDEIAERKAEKARSQEQMAVAGGKKAKRRRRRRDEDDQVVASAVVTLDDLVLDDVVHSKRCVIS